MHFLRGEWVCYRFDTVLFVVEEAQIIVEERDDPNTVFDFPQSEDLACKDLAEIDFSFPDTDSAASCDAHGAVMERVVRLVGRPIGAGRRCIEFTRIGTAQSLMGPFIVVNLDEVIEAAPAAAGN